MREIRETRRIFLKEALPVAELSPTPTEAPAAVTPQSASVHVLPIPSAVKPLLVPVSPDTKSSLFGAWRGGKGKGSSMPALKDSPLGAKDGMG